MEYQHLSLELLSHDSIRIKTTKPENMYLYFDPYQLPEDEPLPRADILFITHPHYDHCSIADIRKIIKKDTIIVTVPDAQSKLVSMGVAAVKLIEPGKTITIKNISVTAVPAYNTDKQFHPKENEWVGFIVNISGVNVYVAGDTDIIPEMNTFPQVDVAFLPVSGTYVMTAEEAAKAARIMKSSVSIPMHYGSIIGTKDDAKKFVTLVKGMGLRGEIL